MTLSGRWRRLFAVLMTFVVAFAGIALVQVVMPSTASAIPGLSDCTDAPTPEVPGRGVEAFFEPAPATPPPSADPFAAGATTSIHEQYGYAGLRWNTYDLGCAGSPEASVGSTVGNWLFTIPKAVVAATGAMLGASFDPQFLSVFDPLIGTVTDALRRSVFDQWAGLVLAALGFLIVWRARRASLRGTAAAVGWALLVMVLATVVFRWPLAAGQAADSTVTTTMSAVTTALGEHDAAGRASTGSQAADNLHDALLYQVWLGGEFGDANSATARRWGPQLFDSQALTWAQAATLAQDPAAGQQIIEAKKAKFKDIAGKVKAEDPDAYEYLVGRRSDARIGFAALSLFAVACAVPFLLTAALLIVGALIITRFAVMLFPAIATLGLFPTMRGLIIGVGNTVAAAVINAIVFGLGSAVMVKAFGVIMAPGSGLPAWLVVALVLLLTLVMWVALRPFQRLTAMTSTNRNPFADAAGALGTVTRGLGRASGRLVGTAAGVLVGESAANARRDEHDKDSDGERAPRAEADRRTGEDGEGTGPGELAAARRRPALPGGPRSEREGGGVLGRWGGAGGSGRSGAPAASGAGGGTGSAGTGRVPGRRRSPAGGSSPGGQSGEAAPGELVAAEVGLARTSRSDREGAAVPRPDAGRPERTASASAASEVPASEVPASGRPASERPVSERPVSERSAPRRPVPRRSEAVEELSGDPTDDAYAVYRPRDPHPAPADPRSADPWPVRGSEG